MLTIPQVNKLYQAGVVPYLLATCGDDSRGMYYPESKRINIYPNNHASQRDLEETILHEFLHARNDIAGKECVKSDEEQVETEACLTWKHNHEVCRHILALYALEKRKNWKTYFTSRKPALSSYTVSVPTTGTAARAQKQAREDHPPQAASLSRIAVAISQYPTRHKPKKSSGR